jgi:hypothetical protein
MINSFIGLLLLVVLCMAAALARAQNQTPANVGPVVGAWTDPATGLTWTKSDNGSDVNWNQAIAYCSNLRLGGYSDWRLPTIDELQDIYDPGIDIPGQWPGGDAITWHVKGNLNLTTWEWSSSLKNAREAWLFYFANGMRYSLRLSESSTDRALCVRR